LPVDLDSYAAGAERFLSELDREYHLHFSGQKDDYEVEAVYERHASLFERSAVEGLREAVATAEGDQLRRASYLLELAVDGHMGRACAAEEAAIAAREAELELEVDGERISYRGAPIALVSVAARYSRSPLPVRTVTSVISDTRGEPSPVR